MDVFSEIEIEAFAFEEQGLEQSEEFVTNDGVALEIETKVISTFLGEAQYFDAFEPMWQNNSADITQIIDPEAAEWLAAFVDGSVVDSGVVGDGGADKTEMLFTEGDDEDIDEVIVTGTRPDPWVTSITLGLLGMLNLIIEVASDPEIPDRWKMKPPKTPTDGVQVDRAGLTIPDNKDTDAQEETEDLLADLLADLWTALMRAEGGDLTVEWGSEYNETLDGIMCFRYRLWWGNLSA